MAVDDAPKKFNLLDLRGALVNYLTQCTGGSIHHIGGHRSADHMAPLPFPTIEI